MYRGIWADLPVQPRNRKRVIAVTTAPPGTRAPGALAKTVSKSSDPKRVKMRNIATRNPKSPMRLTMNAFLPASALTLSLNQKPMSR